MYRISFNQIITIILLSLVVTTVSCREDSDDVKCYAYEDELNFIEANSSLEGQFKAIWTAMNCNYPMWDYEEQQGLNWDKVYDEYLPRFKELDKEYNATNPVPDSLVYELYDSIFAPLHDGHLYMYLKNIHTGKRIQHTIFPQIENDVDNIDPSESVYLDLSFMSREDFTEYVAAEYYAYAQFKDDIVYLKLPKFNLKDTFKERDSNESKDRICKLWESWFNCIQSLQSTGSLKGIIIDLRNNPGGSANDYQYVLGALHNGNYDNGRSHQVGYLREKSGIGRLDFSVLYPDVYPVYAKEHVTVEAPIVVLANGNSASMAEITTLSAKQLKNGYVIGTKTYGAFSPLLEAVYAFTYAGSVGDVSLYFAPFFIKIPRAAYLSLDGQFMDGVGVEPNEIVRLDYSELRNNRKDNQLDRALEYIRTKKDEQ